MQSKLFVFVGVVALGSALDAADSITTRNGITYANVVIQRADPDGVVIEYAPQPGSVGMAKLKFANLPDDLRQRYNYSATDAVTFEQNQAAGNARREEQIAQGEIEKQRKHDKLAQQRAEKEAALEAKLQEAAAMASAQMEMGGWGGGYGSYGIGDGYGTGRRRYRSDSRSPDKFHPHEADTLNSHGIGLSTGLGTGWGDSGHFGPLPSQPSHASPGPSHSGAFRNPPARGNPAAGSSSTTSR